MSVAYPNARFIYCKVLPFDVTFPGRSIHVVYTNTIMFDYVLIVTINENYITPNKYEECTRYLTFFKMFTRRSLCYGYRHVPFNVVFFRSSIHWKLQPFNFTFQVKIDLMNEAKNKNRSKKDKQNGERLS